MDIPAIAAEALSLNARSSEGDVNGVWNSILNWVFDLMSGYITRPQAMHTLYGGTHGYSDFHTFQHVHGQRKYFLITQCKSSTGEGSDAAWDNGSSQLQWYLEIQHGTRPVGQRTPVYGILAIGRRVRFYRYNDTRREIVGFRPAANWANSHGGRRFFDIIDDAVWVQSALRHILHNH